MRLDPLARVELGVDQFNRGEDSPIHGIVMLARRVDRDDRSYVRASLADRAGVEDERTRILER